MYKIHFGESNRRHRLQLTWKMPLVNLAIVTENDAISIDIYLSETIGCSTFLLRWIWSRLTCIRICRQYSTNKHRSGPLQMQEFTLLEKQLRFRRNGYCDVKPCYLHSTTPHTTCIVFLLLSVDIYNMKWTGRMLKYNWPAVHIWATNGQGSHVLFSQVGFVSVSWTLSQFHSHDAHVERTFKLTRGYSERRTLYG